MDLAALKNVRFIPVAYLYVANPTADWLDFQRRRTGYGALIRAVSRKDGSVTVTFVLPCFLWERQLSAVFIAHTPEGKRSLLIQLDSETRSISLSDEKGEGPLAVSDVIDCIRGVGIIVAGEPPFDYEPEDHLDAECGGAFNPESQPP